MQITISKADLNDLISLSDKCVAIVQRDNPTLREYNYARRLRLIMKKVRRINKL